RSEVAKDEPAEHTVDAVVGEGNPLSHGDNPIPHRAQRKHFYHRVEADDLALTEVGGTGSAAQVENYPRRKHVDSPAAPLPLLANREDPVDQVVAGSDLRKDRVGDFARAVIESNPV